MFPKCCWQDAGRSLGSFLTWNLSYQPGWWYLLDSMRHRCTTTSSDNQTCPLVSHSRTHLRKHSNEHHSVVDLVCWHMFNFWVMTQCYGMMIFLCYGDLKDPFIVFLIFEFSLFQTHCHCHQPVTHPSWAEKVALKCLSLQILIAIAIYILSDPPISTSELCHPMIHYYKCNFFLKTKTDNLFKTLAK